MRLDGKTGLVVLNMGGPASLADVAPFLYNVFSDPLMIRLPWYLRPLQRTLARRIVRRRGEEARRNYEAIGGESPLLRITGAQANKVAALLGCEGYVAMRYWHPFADEAVGLMLQEGMERAVVISGYPQHSRSTNESAIHDFKRAWLAKGRSAADLLMIESWADDPGYIQAVASSVREAIDALPAKDAHIVFSAHGLPERYIRQGDRYLDDLKLTLDLVIAELKPKVPYTLAFQSKASAEKWLSPSTPEVIERLASEGVRHLAIVPLGFISDHVETLQEIDQLFASMARKHGMLVYRAPSLNDRPDFVEALAALVRRRAAANLAEPACR